MPITKTSILPAPPQNLPQHCEHSDTIQTPQSSAPSTESLKASANQTKALLPYVDQQRRLIDSVRSYQLSQTFTTLKSADCESSLSLSSSTSEKNEAEPPKPTEPEPTIRIHQKSLFQSRLPINSMEDDRHSSTEEKLSDDDSPEYARYRQSRSANKFRCAQQ